jgi:hypothetical protein
MMNIVVAPILQNRGDLHCPSQTDELILLLAQIAFGKSLELNTLANSFKTTGENLDYLHYGHSYPRYTKSNGTIILFYTPIHPIV